MSSQPKSAWSAAGVFGAANCGRAGFSTTAVGVVPVLVGPAADAVVIAHREHTVSTF